MPEDKFAVVEDLRYTPSTIVSTMTLGPGAGFYASEWGPLPFMLFPSREERYQLMISTLRMKVLGNSDEDIYDRLPLPLWERVGERGSKLFDFIMQVALADRAGLFAASKLDAFFEPLAHSRFYELAYRAEALAAAVP